MPAAGRPPALDGRAPYLVHGARRRGSLFGRGDGAQRALPMTAAELLEAEVLVYSRGLGVKIDAAVARSQKGLTTCGD